MSTICEVKPWRSIQRWYMRRSISAQSQDSVPPAPEWMVTKAFERSNSPPRRLRSSISSRRLQYGSVLREDLLRGGGLGLGLGLAEGEFLEDGEVVDLALEGEEGVDLCAQGGDFLDGALGAVLVAPEIGGAHAPRRVRLGGPGVSGGQRYLRSSLTRACRAGRSTEERSGDMVGSMRRRGGNVKFLGEQRGMT